jgi:plastocyanin
VKIAVIALAFASLSSSAIAASVQVDISKFAFTPREITVKPGTTVVWTNRDQTPHTISAKDGAFVSAGMDTGDTYTHTFTREGDASYFCTVHPFMTGIVHVRQ